MGFPLSDKIAIRLRRVNLGRYARVFISKLMIERAGKNVAMMFWAEQSWLRFKLRLRDCGDVGELGLSEGIRQCC